MDNNNRVSVSHRELSIANNCVENSVTVAIRHLSLGRIVRKDKAGFVFNPDAVIKDESRYEIIKEEFEKI